MITLDQLNHGQIAQIHDVFGADAISLRLLEIGFFDGQWVTRTGQAPTGDPIEYSLAGCRVGLRKTEAARIFVEISPSRL